MGKIQFVTTFDSDFAAWLKSNSHFLPEESLGFDPIDVTAKSHWQYSLGAGFQADLFGNPMTPMQFLFFYQRALEQQQLAQSVLDSMESNIPGPEGRAFAESRHKFGIEVGQWFHFGGAERQGLGLFGALRPWIGYQRTCDSTGYFHECDKNSGEMLTTYMGWFDDGFNFDFGDESSHEVPATVAGISALVGVDPVSPRDSRSGILVYLEAGVDPIYSPWPRADKQGGTHAINDTDTGVRNSALYEPTSIPWHMAIGLRFQGNPFKAGARTGRILGRSVGEPKTKEPEEPKPTVD